MARSFNGTSDVITCTGANVDGASKASISAWIYRASTGTTCGGGFSHAISTGGGRFSFTWFTDGNIYTAVENAAQAFASTALGGTGWHHVALVFDGTQSTDATRVILYIDGVASTLSFSGPTPTTLGTVSPLTWGKDSSDRFCGGVIGVGAAWSTALTAGEALALARGARPYLVRPKLLVGDWPLDGLSSPEPDFSGNANNGTLTGTSAAAGPPVTLLTPKWVGAPLASAGGGTTYTDTVSESITAADSFATVTTYNISYTDSVTSSDSFATVTTYNVSYTDSVTAADAIANGNIFDLTLSEAITPADSLAVAVTWNASFSDAVTTADSLSTVTTYGASLAEVLSLLDSMAASGGTSNTWTIVSGVSSVWNAVTPISTSWTKH